ncbi:MAG: prepilin-type N-terminal cleavage/methylation domain-containing protein [Burkholderiaceae bacterium]
MVNERVSMSVGFTIIELMVVLACIGLLLSIAAPRYVQHVDHAREVTLRQDLQNVRTAIDQFKADQGRFPRNLDELATRRYLNAVPVDPMTGRADSWRLDAAEGQAAGSVVDLHSGAIGVAQDGSAYASW